MLHSAVGVRAGQGESRRAWHRRGDVRTDPWCGEEYHPGCGKHECDHRGGVHKRSDQAAVLRGSDNVQLYDVSGIEDGAHGKIYMCTAHGNSVDCRGQVDNLFSVNGTAIPRR